MTPKEKKKIWIRSLFVIIPLLLILLTWTGLALVRVIQSHHELVASLSVRGGFNSNIIDPKPYLHKASVSLFPSFTFFFVNPFRKEMYLIYDKKGYVVCRASNNGEQGKWYLEIPQETLNVIMPPPYNIFEKLFPNLFREATPVQEKSENSSNDASKSGLKSGESTEK